MALKILVDAREAVRNKSGIGVVAREIISRLQLASNDIEFVTVKPSESRLFNSTFGRFFEFLWWKVVYIRSLALRHRCDYVFSLDPVNTVFGTKNIVFVHDLIFFIYPQWTGVWGRLWRTLLPFSVNKNQLIFTNSKCTSDDIYQYIPTIDKNIPIIALQLGYDKSVFNLACKDESMLSKYNLPVDLQYIMYVGNAEPRRNLHSVIKAVAWCNRSLGREFHLVVCGRNDAHREEILRAAEQEGVVHCVHIVGYLDDRELAQFYRQARAYLYPSFYEGFGLTVIEAMACGCPVITSNNSSLKDVAGDAALLVDPADQAAISTALARVLSDEDLRNKLINAGYRNSEKYDWDKMVETIVVAVKGLADNARHC